MKIKLKQIPISSLVDGYIDKGDNGVYGYGGKLDIRPPYQREMVYKDKQREAVINSIRKEFPINVMYWVQTDSGYEVLDGQQRTISICQYVAGLYSIKSQYFHNLEADEQEQILNYKVMVYFCEGSDKDKLDWFETINISGEKLTAQELRNAVYTGPWLADAKKHFSKTGCAAYGLAGDYLKGVAIRQDYLENAIKWHGDGKIEDYMSENQHKPNASELWLYFQQVMSWAKSTYPEYRKEMKGIAWGLLYNEFGQDFRDSVKMEEEVTRLMQDEDVSKKAGIYEYLLSGSERLLSIRAFTPNQKTEAYERQGGICPGIKEESCGEHFELKEMEADHITPWSQGGKTSPENCMMLCKKHNRMKSDKY